MPRSCTGARCCASGRRAAASVKRPVSVQTASTAVKPYAVTADGGAVTPMCRSLLRRTLCALPVALMLGFGASSASAVLVPNPTSLAGRGPAVVGDADDERRTAGPAASETQWPDNNHTPQTVLGVDARLPHLLGPEVGAAGLADQLSAVDQDARGAVHAGPFDRQQLAGQRPGRRHAVLTPTTSRTPATRPAPRPAMRCSSPAPTPTRSPNSRSPAARLPATPPCPPARAAIPRPCPATRPTCAFTDAQVQQALPGLHRRVLTAHRPGRRLPVHDPARRDHVPGRQLHRLLERARTGADGTEPGGDQRAGPRRWLLRVSLGHRLGQQRDRLRADPLALPEGRRPAVRDGEHRPRPAARRVQGLQRSDDRDEGRLPGALPQGLPARLRVLRRPAPTASRRSSR